MHNALWRNSTLAACLIIMLITFGAHLADAQTAMPNDFQLFRAGGRNDHIILYPLGAEIQRDNVIAALDEATLYYQAVWGGGDRLPFQIAVGFLNRLNEGDPTVYADAVYAPSSEAAFLRGYEVGLTIEPSICAIEIYTFYESDPGRLSTIAHELAHCYQYFYQIGQVNRGYNPNRMKWWVEGSAEWFASLVYPLQYPGERQEEFIYNYDVLTRSYDNMYWWTFLASPQGLGSPEAVIAFLRSLPANPGQYASAVNAMRPGENAVEVFHRWAFALLDGRVPFNPPVSFARVQKVNASSPGSRQLFTERFSVEYATLAGFTTDPGNRAFLQVDGIDANHYGVSVRVGGQNRRLTSGEPYLFCPDANGATLIISRGIAGRDDINPFTVSWGQMPSDTPCVEEEEDDDNAECIVGNWQVIDFPPTIAGLPGATVDTSSFIYTFGEGGALFGTYAITARSDGTTITVNVPFSGTYAVSAIEGNATELAVDSWAWAFDAGGSMIMTAPDGTRTDLSRAFYNSGGIDGWTPNGTIICDGDTLSWSSADGFGGFVMQRQ